VVEDNNEDEDEEEGPRRILPAKKVASFKLAA
jgi:hypothetical protein